MVVAHMAEGASLTSFAAEIDVARDTITEWASVYPEFSLAVKRAKAKCAAWWEERGREGAKAGAPQGANTLIIFGLKNMAPDEWADKQLLDHRSSDGSMTPQPTRIVIEAATAPTAEEK